MQGTSWSPCLSSLRSQLPSPGAPLPGCFFVDTWVPPTPVHGHAALHLSRIQVQSHPPPPAPSCSLCEKVQSLPCGSLGLYHLLSPVPQQSTFSLHESGLLLLRCYRSFPALGVFASAGPYAKEAFLLPSTQFTLVLLSSIGSITY